MLHDVFLDVFEGLFDRFDLRFSVFVDLVVFEAVFDAGAEFRLDFVFRVASILLEILRYVFGWAEECQLTVVDSRSSNIFMIKFWIKRKKREAKLRLKYKKKSILEQNKYFFINNRLNADA